MSSSLHGLPSPAPARAAPRGGTPRRRKPGNPKKLKCSPAPAERSAEVAAALRSPGGPGEAKAETPKNGRNSDFSKNAQGLPNDAVDLLRRLCDQMEGFGTRLADVESRSRPTDAVRAAVLGGPPQAPNPPTQGLGSMLENAVLGAARRAAGSASAHGPAAQPVQVPRDESSGESSADSSDSETDRRGRRRRERKVRKGDYTAERYAPIFLNGILKYHTSVRAWVDKSALKQGGRKYNEAASTAQAIDALRAEGVDAKYEGVEILVRRMVALEMAEKHRDETYIEAVEWAPRDEVVPAKLLKSIMKDVERRKKIKPKWQRNNNDRNGGLARPSAKNNSPPGGTGKGTSKGPAPSGGRG